MSLESRVGKIEEAIVIMKDLLVSHNDRLDDYFNALTRERQERSRSFKPRATKARRISQGF